MQRSLHIIDIENLAGADHAHLDAVVGTITAYRRVAEIGPTDQFIIGTNMNPYYRLTVGLEWPGAQLVSGHGPDGADRALLMAVDRDWVIRRGFARVVIGSGDRCFAALGTQLKRAGVTVQVVGRPHETHHSLWTASHDVAVLPEREGVLDPVGPRTMEHLATAA